MTLPNEMFNSIRNANHFLQALMDPKKTPGVSKEIRMRARDRLKHFPSDWEVDNMEKIHSLANTDPSVALNNSFKCLSEIRHELILIDKRINTVGQKISETISNNNNQ